MSRKTVLLVEDDEVLGEMYRARFEQESFALVFVQDAEAAQVKLKAGGVDLMLLDIMLPGMSGLDLLHWVREQDKLKELPVFLLSALSTDEDKMRGKELGATGYLAKSENTPEQIVEVVKQTLG